MTGINDLGHLAGREITAGPTTTFGQNFDAVFDLTRKVDSTLGFEYEVEKRWMDSLAAAQAKLGEDFGYNTSSSKYGDMAIPVIHRFVQPAIDPNGERVVANFFADTNTPEKEPEIAALYDKARVINDRIKQLNDPSIMSMDQIIEDVIADRGVIREKAAAVQEQAGWGGTFGGIAGGIAGSFSARDPLNIITAPFGGFGKSVAMRLATEAAVVGGTEYGVQKLSVQPTQRLLGEPESNAALQALIVGAGAGVLRGGFEGISALVSRALRRGEPLTDGQLRELFENQQQSPRARAGLSLLDDAEQFHAANPYSPSTVGLRQFNEDLADISNLMSGKTETAVARFLPEREFTIDNLDFDTATVKEQNPLVFARVEETQGRLAEIDNQINQISNTIDVLPQEPTKFDYKDYTTTDAEGVRHYEPEKAAQVLAAVEDATNKGIPVTLHVEGKLVPIVGVKSGRLLDREGQTWGNIGLATDNTGTEYIEISAREGEATLRENLHALRKQRSAAQGQYTRARNALDKEIERVRAEREASRKLLYGSKEATGAEFDPQRLRPDVLARFEADVNANAATLDDTLELTVQTMETPEGQIDLGNGIILDKDFKMIDPENPEKEISAGSLLSRLQEDQALVSAMKECAI